MSLWTKFGCFLTGWSYETLSQCSQASRSHLSKYTSALMILILIWSVTLLFCTTLYRSPGMGLCLGIIVLHYNRSDD